jgi:hypothetical protein
MPTTARPQPRDDLGISSNRTGDVTGATDLGVPRSTARGSLGATSTVVVCLDVADLTEPEVRQEVLTFAPTRPEAHDAAPAHAVRRTSGCGSQIANSRADSQIWQRCVVPDV